MTLDRHHGEDDSGEQGVYAIGVDPVTGKAVEGGRGFWIPGDAGVSSSSSSFSAGKVRARGGDADGDGREGCVCSWTTMTMTT
jgi:hypothetical protein